jgi:hypothetical protein
MGMPAPYHSPQKNFCRNLFAEFSLHAYRVTMPTYTPVQHSDPPSGEAGRPEQMDSGPPGGPPRPGGRLARLAALGVGGFLLPWSVLLGVLLPGTAPAQHWSLAWAGLDGAEAVAALVTAVLLARASPRAGLAATAGGTLLLADAWFDVCTAAPGLDHALAVAEAACVELPLAAGAFWLATALTRRSHPEIASWAARRSGSASPGSPGVARRSGVSRR